MVNADVVWMLICAAFVWLMVPGLALFYGGFSGIKQGVNTIAMVLIAIAIGGVIWFSVGYSLAFSGDGPIIGDLHNAFFQHVSLLHSTRGLTIPDGVFALFQGMFPMITMAIIAGSVVGRMNFKAFMIFLCGWMLFIYVPLAHMVWGGGILAQHGALDFAGGDVVHISSGVSGLVLALIIGKRQKVTSLMAHNLFSVVVGGGLLWFGWFGFNAGSALAANGTAILAFINTNIAAATAMLAWVLCEYYLIKQIKVSGALSGAIAGLVAITPAAGYVDPLGAFLMGMLNAMIVFMATTVIKYRLGYDDTLDAFGLHGVGGIVGGLLTGVFAQPVLAHQKGLIFGDANLLGHQAVAILVTVAISVIGTLILARVIQMITPLRISKDYENSGIDVKEHGETLQLRAFYH